MPRASTLAYGKVAGAYDAFLTLTGFKRGVEKFLGRLEWPLPSCPKILDAGCGTGLMSIWFAKRLPDAAILAFDIDANMLREMEEIVEREEISRERLVIALGDLTNPNYLHIRGTHELAAIPENHFDAIVVSGALEHVPLAPTVERLVRLLKPGGIFFNLGVRRNPAGAVLGMVYRFRPYRLTELRRACEQAGLEDIRVIRLSVEDFPANLSRIAILARRKN
ncbi:MAG: methyltransferase domain-containing protein [Candidatus Sungbacteria bacterium]|uniref:Methyltransferase domain-containing protein n=1 Tax=Candidatus Sungiibacteriota bacterium TaxID=2750080 RepID=A0A933DRT7_9BACT|nr:methyltransferase domain-containing protein [Candidatus Sungbacteria bacterium]